MIYNIVLVAGVQQWDQYLYTLQMITIVSLLNICHHTWSQHFFFLVIYVSSSAITRIYRLPPKIRSRATMSQLLPLTLYGSDNRITA